MMRSRLRWLVCLVLTGSPIGQAEEAPNRVRIRDRYKWDLSEIYPSLDAWRTAKDAVVAQLPKLTQLSTAPHKWVTTLSFMPPGGGEPLAGCARP